MSKAIFITGIGTDVGKTIVSAVFVEKLKADYWKPVQSGDLANSDTIKVQRLISNKESVFHPETYRLTEPFSPHKSADLDGVQIDLNDFSLPQTANTLIIEGAGGLMVPLNNHTMMIDLVEKLDVEVVLVSRNYLGSINHTLLSIDALLTRGIKIKCIVFNGDSDSYSENVIEQYTRFEIPVLRIGTLAEINQTEVLKAADALNYKVL